MKKIKVKTLKQKMDMLGRNGEQSIVGGMD